MKRGRKSGFCREQTLQLFQDHKWVILIRDVENEDWRVFCHQWSKRPMHYSTLATAILILKTTHKFRYIYGNAKLAKLDGHNLAI